MNNHENTLNIYMISAKILRTYLINLIKLNLPYENNKLVLFYKYLFFYLKQYIK